MSDVNQGIQGGQRRGTGILVAALVGAAVGAGVALLFAPCSGRETRGWLANKGREMKHRTASVLEDGKEATRLAAKELVKGADDGAPLEGASRF